MEIGTGYFAKAKTYAEMGYALVSIAKVAPWFLAKNLTLYDCDALKPTDEILSLKDDPRKYESLYEREILSKLNPVKVFKHLYLIAHQVNTDKVILLCYESPEKFCHRHIVAKWLNKSIYASSKIKEIETNDAVQPSFL